MPCETGQQCEPLEYPVNQDNTADTIVSMPFMLSTKTNEGMQNFTGQGDSVHNKTAPGYLYLGHVYKSFTSRTVSARVEASCALKRAELRGAHYSAYKEDIFGVDSFLGWAESVR